MRFRGSVFRSQQMSNELSTHPKSPATRSCAYNAIQRLWVSVPAEIHELSARPKSPATRSRAYDVIPSLWISIASPLRAPSKEARSCE